jgi:hypothetical protein
MTRWLGGRWIGVVLVCLGLFGVAFSVSGLLSPLQPPSLNGTCGPGQGSEAAIVAIFDPITIGAGPEPPANQPQNRARWSTFVHACQTSSDQRAAVTLPVVVVSAGLAVFGSVLLWRRSRRPTGDGRNERSTPWSTPSVPVGDDLTPGGDSHLTQPLPASWSLPPPP